MLLLVMTKQSMASHKHLSKFTLQSSSEKTLSLKFYFDLRPGLMFLCVCLFVSMLYHKSR